MIADRQMPQDKGATPMLDLKIVNVDERGNEAAETDLGTQQDGCRAAEKSILSLPVQAAPDRATVKGISRRGVNLKTHAQLRREAAGVYRDVRAGRLPSAEGTRLVYMLGQIGRLIEQAALLSKGSEKTYEDCLAEMHAMSHREAQRVR